MNIRTIVDVERHLRPYTERSMRGRFTLDTTRKLASLVGNPEQRLRVIHVAGTSGKTTTCYYIAELLHAANNTVGLTVSPHIASIAERVQIDAKPLEEDRFVAYFNEYITLVESSSLQPSYFELMMVFALWVFDREHVDYAVIETGLGGLHDTSNICRREDKICVITDIGFDHMHILGNTLGEIASQKAGIIATNNRVVMYEQSHEVMDAVRLAIQRESAQLDVVPDQKANTYFARNFDLAYVAYQLVAERDELEALDQQVQNYVLDTTRIPGRLEEIVVENTSFILDGAHNEQKMATLFSTLDYYYPNVKMPIIVALKADKTINSVIDTVAAHASKIIATEFRSDQDMPFGATPASELVQLFAAAHAGPAEAITPIEDALLAQIGTNTPQVLVTGSFFAVAEARAWLLARSSRTQH